MAIDTAAKRRSAAGVIFLPFGPGVTPDATKPPAWRQQAAWSYSGIAIISIIASLVCAAITIRPAVAGSATIRSAVTGTPGIRECD